MGRVCFVRKTLRIHDNPMLHLKDIECFVFVLDESRFPENDESASVYSNAWSRHQFAFLLKTLQGHRKDILARGMQFRVIQFKTAALAVKHLSKHFKNAVADVVDDPAYDPYDKALLSLFQKVEFVCTNTLVDWLQVRHASFSKVYWTSAYSKTKKLKAYIVENLRPEPKNDSIDPRKKPCRATVDDADLASLVIKFPSSYPFKALSTFSRNDSLEQCILAFSDKSLNVIGDPGWSKPRTARNLGLQEYSSEPRYNSSKLSPFFAIGALSVLRCFRKLQGSHKDSPPLGSGADQLLFRECWYCAASTDSRRDAFWSNSAVWWDSKYKYKPDAPLKSETWTNNAIVWKWAVGSMDASWQDTNESMHLLRKAGWIHHLRRHLVADVLCRGKLGQHFIYGEQWFRHTEIDFDAAINRANWLWLSANAFSTKQYFAHYKPSDYIQRGSRKVDCILKTSKTSVKVCLV